LAAAKLNFKWVVLYHLKELEGVPYTVGKVWKSSFQPNLNHHKIQLVAPVMIKKKKNKKVAKGQTGRSYSSSLNPCVMVLVPPTSPS
jgi:hypothetical protein